MDAKPHRPLRALKLRDENLPPLPAAGGKSIHQRNKSSPALSTLAAAGAFKLGQKRTVFADVSNTARGMVRDDSAITSKTVLEPLKEVSTNHAKIEPAPLQRPAQRPLSVSGSFKGFLNTFAGVTLSSSSKPAPLESQEQQQQQQQQPSTTNIRKSLQRKSTVVFKENSIAEEVLPVPVEEKDITSVAILPTATTDSFTVEDWSKEQEVIDVPTFQESVISQYDSGYQVIEPAPLFDHLDYHPDWVHLDHNPEQRPKSPDLGQSSESIEIYEDAQAHQPSVIDPRLISIPHTSLDMERPTEKLYRELPLEYNENWAEETYDDQYEDEGYTTARSIKSKGDYTTGPTTVVLAPKVTSKVERELAEARKYVEDTKTAEDIEEDECWDTSMVAEYGDEIFAYMRTLEERMRPNPYYMENQTEVQWSMRSVLMDWLVQVHHRFGLLPETLFLCVNYIDRFLSCKVVSLGKLQLVGATAIFVAAKYEEINCPSIQEIIYMVDGGYTMDEVLKAERFMLSMLQFELGWPGPMSFLRRISKADDYDLETRTLAKYFLELTIMDERFVGCIPSFTAAGAHCLARLMLKKGPWSPAHVYYSNYTYSQLRPLLSAMLSCCEDPQKHHAAVYDKYADKRFKRASLFVHGEITSGFMLPSTTRHSIQYKEDNDYYWRLK